MKTSHKVPELSAWLPQIREWFASDLGQQLLEQEKQVVDTMMDGVFGYHLLQVGVLPGQVLYEQSTASHKFMMLPDECAPEALISEESLLVGSADDLPLASECIDAVVLHHALDFTARPHQVLREASRVLRPGGKLIVVGFNPASFWGLYRAMVKRRKPVPWKGWFISQRRLNDWLTLLELKEEQHEGGFYRPPFASDRWMRRLGWIESIGQRYLNDSGGFYVFLATKETFSVTPLTQGWRRKITMPLIPRPAQQAGRSAAKGRAINRSERDDDYPRGVLYSFPTPEGNKSS